MSVTNCNIHSHSPIQAVSKNLYDYYINNKKVNIIGLKYLTKENKEYLRILVTDNENQILDLGKHIDGKTFDDKVLGLDMKYECSKCFNDYITRYKISIDEHEIFVSNDDLEF